MTLYTVVGTYIHEPESFVDWVIGPGTPVEASNQVIASRGGPEDVEVIAVFQGHLNDVLKDRP